ncbi:MAG TPA: DinB family protein, partial [Cyclobacteriaceae bacterium]
MTIENFNHTIDHWIKELERYTFIQLCAKPSPTSWSLGQMYRHLIDDANFYVEQIKMCVVNNDHANEEATAHGKAMLYNNDFPNEVIEGS